MLNSILLKKSLLLTDQDFVFSKKHKFLYAVNAKVGTTTLISLILKLEDKKSRRSLELLNNANFLEIRKILSDKEYFKFRIVRNPYTRLLSAYKSKIKKCEEEERFFKYLQKLIKKCSIKNGYNENYDEIVTFKEFIYFIKDKNPKTMDVHWMPQVLTTMNKYIKYDFTGRFENIDEDMDYVAKKLNFTEEIRFKGIKTNASEDIKSYYNDELLEIVYNLYKEDFETFGYKKDII